MHSTCKYGRCLPKTLMVSLKIFVAVAVLSCGSPPLAEAGDDNGGVLPFAVVGRLSGSFARLNDPNPAVAVETPFNSDGSLLLLGSDDKGVRVFDCRTLKAVTAFLPHVDLCYASFINDGARLFTAGGKTICYWDVHTSKLLVSVPVLNGNDDVRLAAATPDGSRFVVTGLRSTTLWRNDGAAVSAIGKLRVERVDSLGFSRPENGFYTIETMPRDPGTPLVRFWSPATGAELFKPTVFGQEDLIQNDCTEGVVGPVGKRVLVAEHAAFSIFDFESGKRLAHGKTEPVETPVRHVYWSPTGRQVFVTTFFRDPDSVQVFDAATGMLARSFAPHTVSLAPFPDGKWIICFMRGTGQPCLWDVQSGKCLQVFGEGGFAAAVSPNGKRVAVNIDDHVTSVWELVRGVPVRPIASLPSH